jgi:hypothetical protein
MTTGPRKNQLSIVDSLVYETRQTEVSELIPSSILDRLAHARHEFQVEVQIVNRIQARRKHFGLQKQMPQIGF